MKVGRVIARPFTGDCGHFKRTSNRRDFAIAPPAPTLLDWVSAPAGDPWHRQDRRHLLDARHRQAVEGQERRRSFRTSGAAGAQAEEGSLTFANFVEFDTLYGHPRDVAGYARALEWFDAGLPRFLAGLRPGDLALFTADHGNDPTWKAPNTPANGCRWWAGDMDRAPSGCAALSMWAPAWRRIWAWRRRSGAKLPVTGPGVLPRTPQEFGPR